MKNKRGIALHGWLVLDKPLGMTSTQALNQAQRLLNAKKAGHGGTLDPLASGVLPLAFGEATKLISYAMDSRKIYECTIKWGEATETDDTEGAVIATSPKRPTEAEILAALPQFIGTISQMPPAYSALKVNGKRAYALARAGEKVELSPRFVEVGGFELLEMPDSDHARFRISCGKGTYIRSLGRDLAETLGSCGHLTALRRVQCGKFSLEGAIPLAMLEKIQHKGAASFEALLPLDAVLDDIPAREITEQEARRLRQGLPIAALSGHTEPQLASVMLAKFEQTPIALISPKEDADLWHPVRGFNL